jgi:hypothetical protein
MISPCQTYHFLWINSSSSSFSSLKFVSNNCNEDDFPLWIELFHISVHLEVVTVSQKL